MHGTFGKRSGPAYTSSLGDTTMEDGFMLKELRIWTEQRDFENIYTQRSSQIDPIYYKNENLFFYLRLAESNGALVDPKNFARFNPKIYDSP
jgi:hypothetical protein